MTRIPSHTLTEAPAASRPLLEGAARSSPTGKPLNLHAQMAHSPAVLAAYTSIREAIAAHGTLDSRVRSALMLATAGVSHSGYAEDVTSRLALRTGWTQAEVLALRDGRSPGDDKLGALIAVVREAAGRAGQVGDVTWERAAACGWTSAELAEAFAYLALTIFTAYFLNYAQTPNDLASTHNAVAVGAKGTE